MSPEELRVWHIGKADAARKRAATCRAMNDNLKYHAGIARIADKHEAFHLTAAGCIAEQMDRVRREWSNGYDQGYADSHEDAQP